MAAFDETDEVRAKALMDYNATRGTWIALLFLQYRPHAPANAAIATQITAAFQTRFQAAGWESPALMFRGGHLASTAQVPVVGALGTGDVTITGDGELMYAGPLTRPPAWAQTARKAGSIGVIVGFDPSLDNPDVWGDLGALADKGLLLAAYGKLIPPAAQPGVNPFRKPR